MFLGLIMKPEFVFRKHTRKLEKNSVDLSGRMRISNVGSILCISYKLGERAVFFVFLHLNLLTFSS